MEKAGEKKKATARREKKKRNPSQAHPNHAQQEGASLAPATVDAAGPAHTERARRLRAAMECRQGQGEVRRGAVEEARERAQLPNSSPNSMATGLQWWRALGDSQPDMTTAECIIDVVVIMTLAALAPPSRSPLHVDAPDLTFTVAASQLWTIRSLWTPSKSCLTSHLSSLLMGQ